MRIIDDETGRTEPYQIIAPDNGAIRACAEMVGKDDPRYFDLNWFARPAEDQNWVQARYDQIDAIKSRRAAIQRERLRPKCEPFTRLNPNLPEAFADLIPAKPYCADFPDYGVSVRPKAIAIQRRHIQLNGPASFVWMLHDIDRSDAYCAHDDANVPPPNVIMINPENGHAHSAILLARPVARHSASRIAPLRFYSAVERGIARRLGADRRYRGLIAKNPLHADWRVEWRRQRPYTLQELADWLSEDDMAPDASVQSTWGGGRNVTIFDELRAFAYHEVLKFKQNGAGITGLAEFRARLEAVAFGINRQFPMPLALSELHALAKSVSKWVWPRFTPEAFSNLQRHRAQARTRRHLTIIEEIKNGCA